MNLSISKHMSPFITGIVLCAVCPTIAMAASAMITTGYTSQPVGHYEFCKAAPSDCQRNKGGAQPHILTQSSWNQIVAINNLVNKTILPNSDMQIWGAEEVWFYPTDMGDCEDYVLLKRLLLMKAGFKASNLLITVVGDRKGGNHAVLTLRTDRGDFILDNLIGHINEWRDAPYDFLKRQSTTHSGRWVSIEAVNH